MKLELRLDAERSRSWVTRLVKSREPAHDTVALTWVATGASKPIGLESLFDDIAGGDRYPVRKPDGGHLLQLIAGMGGDVTRSVMIGDSENDAAAAQNARVPSIMMRYGYARVDPATLGGVMTLDRFDELPAALDRLGFTASA